MFNIQVKETGIIFITVGLSSIIGQFFIDPNKDYGPNCWTPKVRKVRMIIGGSGLILGGLIIFLFG